MSHEYTRFEEPLYRNYDLYETGPGSLGPGAGLYQNMHKYKSVSDFLKKKRKKKIKLRKEALLKLCNKDCNEVDFRFDSEMGGTLPSYNTLPILGLSGNSPLPQDLSDELEELLKEDED